MEIRRSGAIRRETRILGPGDSLYRKSGGMEQYRGLSSEIDRPGTAAFTDGTKLRSGEAVGDVSPGDMRRIQIRETILSHFEKEEKLFNMGVKPLSSFFIDEVAKYRTTTRRDMPYWANTEKSLKRNIKAFGKQDSGRRIPLSAVSADDLRRCRSGPCRDISASTKDGAEHRQPPGPSSEFSDDVSAYDLILKDKGAPAQLFRAYAVSLFPFRPCGKVGQSNVFQICTLKHSDSQTAKRREVGRGCASASTRMANRHGQRELREAVHEINVLTVIASEKLPELCGGRCSPDIREALYDRRRLLQGHISGKIDTGRGITDPIDGGMAGQRLRIPSAKQLYRCRMPGDRILTGRLRPGMRWPLCRES